MICWHRYEPQNGVYSSTYFKMLDNAVNLCQQNGIYVILDFQQMQWSPYFTYFTSSSGIGFPSWLVSGGGYANSATGAVKCMTDFYLNQGYGVTMRQKYVGFWQYLANRYKNYTCVWAYQLINEPTVIKGATLADTTFTSVMSLYETMTQKIRQIDPNTIIIYDHINFIPNPQNYNAGVERAVSYPNIVWGRSWYDVAYGGYSPSEYGQVKARITNIKNKFNNACGTPFIVNEMGFQQSDFPTSLATNGSAWIRDTFNMMRSIGMNNGYECYSWFPYGLGPRCGFWTGRNSDGSNTFVVSVLKEYMKTTTTITQFFSSGFETGGTTDWTLTSGGATVQSLQKHSGTYALYSNSPSEYVSKSFSGRKVVTAEAWFNIKTATAEFQLMQLRAAGTVVCRMNVKADGTLLLRYLTSGGLVTADSSTVFGSGWHKLSMQVTVGTSDGKVKVLLDGTEISAFTKTGLTNSAYGLMDRLDVGAIYTSASTYAFSVYTDDVAIAGN